MLTFRRFRLLILLLLILAALGGLASTVRVYNGLNKGITIGSCGFEIVGEPGPFCGDY